MTYYDWFLKLIFTVVTLAIGFQGGEVTPLFQIEQLPGFILYPNFHLPIELCVALGYTEVCFRQQQIHFCTNDDRFRSLWWASNDSISYYMYFAYFS